MSAVILILMSQLTGANLACAADLNNDGVVNNLDAGLFAQQFGQGCKDYVDLSWTPPFFNADGSELTNLAGFKIYYGPAQSVAGSAYMPLDINDPAATAHRIVNLEAGRYWFYVTAYNTAGAESRPSGIVVYDLLN